MSLDDTRIALFTHLENNWTTTPIVFDGQTTGDTYVKRSAPWISTYITWAGQYQKSTAAPSIYVAQNGLLIITIFARESSGIATIDQYTDSLFALFRGRSIGNSIIRDLYIDKDENDGVWQKRFLSISFTTRTTETITS